MWLGNIATWNQYTDSTGGGICIQNKRRNTNHGQNISQR